MPELRTIKIAGDHAARLLKNYRASGVSPNFYSCCKSSAGKYGVSVKEVIQELQGRARIAKAKKLERDGQLTLFEKEN